MVLPEDRPVATPTRGRRIPTIAIVLVVVIALAVSAIAAYLVFSRGTPTVELGPAVPVGGYGYIVNVTQAQPANALSDYAAVLALGAAVEGRVSPLVNGSVNGSLIFFDLDRDGRLSAGDAFGISNLPGGTHNLTVLWRGTSVASRTIEVSGVPVVTFSTADPTANGFVFEVAGTSRNEPISKYKVNLQENTSAGTAFALSASMTFTIGSNTYTVAYTDVDSGGTVTAGDSFTVTRTGGLVTNTDYTLYLLWSDGSEVQSATYHSP